MEEKHVLNKITELNYVSKLITVCGTGARNSDVVINTAEDFEQSYLET